MSLIIKDKMEIGERSLTSLILNLQFLKFFWIIFWRFLLKIQLFFFFKQNLVFPCLPDSLASRNFFTPIEGPIISGNALMPTTSGKRNEKDTCLFLFLFPFPLCRERSCARQRWRQKKETPKEQRCWAVLIGRLHLMHWPGPSCNWSPLNCRSLGNCLFFAPTLRLWLERAIKSTKKKKW